MPRMRAACAVLAAALGLAGCSSQNHATGNPTDASTPDVGAGDSGRARDAAPEAIAPRPALTFEGTTLDTAFRAEGAGVFDVDKDGHLDIVTDQYWYAGPSFTPHEIRTPQTFDPATQYSICFAVFPEDVDGDGWTDAVVVPRNSDPTTTSAEPVYWYQNPHGSPTQHWTPYTIAPSTAVETAIFVDLFGDGHHELVMGQAPQNVLAWFAVDPGGDPTKPWTEHPISATGFSGGGLFAHGLGAGDVNGDGAVDVLSSYGWFQGHADRTWTWHAVPFGPNECSRMVTLDVNGDGLADVICARPHDYGIYWLEQQPVPAGAEPTFVDHLIDATLSEMHALVMQDLDGDGIPEIISGKRFWAHGPTGEPGSTDPALLVYYALHRDTQGDAGFDRHTIDSDSGVGTEFTVQDVDGDGRPDVVVSNKKGLFYFHR